MVRQYTVYHSKDLTEFKDECSKLLSERWVCAGGLLIVDRHFHQAFYRELEDIHPAARLKKKRAKPAKRPKKDPT